MAVEEFPCGCKAEFGAKGEVRGVTMCERHDPIFSEHKSFRQMVLDIQCQLLTEKHVPKAKPETVVAPPAEAPVAAGQDFDPDAEG